MHRFGHGVCATSRAAGEPDARALASAGMQLLRIASIFQSPIKPNTTASGLRGNGLTDQTSTYTSTQPKPAKQETRA